MKTKLIIILLLAFGALRPQTTFQKAYGGVDEETNYCGTVINGYLTKTSTNEYLITSGSKSYVGPGNGISAQLLKLNSFGDTIFTRYYYVPPGSGSYGKTIWETRDGNYLMGLDVGIGYGTGLGMIKLTTTGGVLWARGFCKLGEPNYSYTKCMYAGVLRNNSYISCGFYDGYFGHNALMARVDSLGNLLFLKRYTATYSTLLCTRQVTDGNILSIGYCGQPLKLFMMKNDINGNVIWAKSYDLGTFSSCPAEFKEDPNGNLYITGWLSNIANDPSYDGEFFILKTDASGNAIFSKKYGDTDKQWTTDILVGGNNDTYILGSHFTTTNPAIESPFLTKTDTLGNIISTNKYNNLTNTGNIVFAGNNQLAFSGWTDKFGAGMEDTYLCKTNNTGDAGCDIEPLSYTCTTISASVTSLTFSVVSDLTMTNVPIGVRSGGIISTKCQTLDVTGVDESHADSDLEIYPNPFSENIVISSGSYSEAEVRITDINSKTVFEKRLSLEKKKDVNLQTLAPGVYFIRVTSAGESFTKKLIRE